MLQASVAEEVHAEPEADLAEICSAADQRQGADDEPLESVFGEAVEWLNKSLASIAQGDFATANDAARQAESRRRQLGRSYLMRGLAAARRNELAGAEADFEQALRFSPAWSLPYLHRGAVRHRGGSLAGAIADFSEAIRIDPSQIAAYFRRAAALSAQGNFGSAIADLDAALQLKPADTRAQYQRGVARLAAGHAEHAAADFAALLRELNPDIADLPSLPMPAGTVTTCVSGATVAAPQCADNQPQSGPAHEQPLAAATVNEQSENVSAAEAAVAPRESAAAAPADRKEAAAFYARALDYAKRGRFAEARVLADQALAIDPHLTAAIFVRGVAHAGRQELDLAIADFDAVLKASPTDHLALNDRGSARLKRREFDPAIADFSEAIRLAPQLALPRFNRGVARRLLGLRKEAVSDFSEAIRLDARYASAYCQRGQSYAELYEPAAALADFEQTLRLRPDWKEAATRRDEMLRLIGPAKPSDGGAADIEVECLDTDPAPLSAREIRTRSGVDESVAATAAAVALRAGWEDSCDSARPASSAAANAAVRRRVVRAAQAYRGSSRLFRQKIGNWFVAHPILCVLSGLGLSLVATAGLLWGKSATQSGLQWRGEAVARAWLAGDSDRLREFTAPSAAADIQRWLAVHAPPLLEKGAPAAKLSGSIERNDGQTADVRVQVEVPDEQGLPRSYAVYQRWALADGVWYFSPPSGVAGGQATPAAHVGGGTRR